MDTNEIMNALRKEDQTSFPTEIFETESIDIVSYMKQLMSDRDITLSELVPCISYDERNTRTVKDFFATFCSCTKA